MNEKDKKKEFEQVQGSEEVFCTKPFNAESSRMTDEDSPCEVILEK